MTETLEIILVVLACIEALGKANDWYCGFKKRAVQEAKRQYRIDKLTRASESE